MIVSERMREGQGVKEGMLYELLKTTKPAVVTRVVGMKDYLQIHLYREEFPRAFDFYSSYAPVRKGDVVIGRYIEADLVDDGGAETNAGGFAIGVRRRQFFKRREAVQIEKAEMVLILDDNNKPWGEYGKLPQNEPVDIAR